MKILLKNKINTKDGNKFYNKIASYI